MEEDLAPAAEDPAPSQISSRLLRLLGVFSVLIVAAGLVYYLVVGSLPVPQAVLDFFDDGPAGYRLVAVYSEDREEQSFINGVRMAVDDVNATDKKVLGEDIILEQAQEKGVTLSSSLETTVRKTMTLSDRVARTDNLLAVVGHEWSDTAVTASSIYARNDILYLATHATATSLTNHSFDTVFALQPDNATNAAVIASYALTEKLKRVIVFSDKSDYAKESANFFSEAITNAGGDIVYRGYLSGTQRSLDDVIMFILDNEFFSRSDYDAFFIVSSSVDETADFIKRARYLGLSLPILGMEYMFSAAIEENVGKDGMKDVIGVSLYDRDNISDRGQSFIKSYQERFGSLPDLNAALGYDAVTLIRDAVERAGSLDSGPVSDTLKVARYKTPFTGVTGPLVFDRNGAITDTQVFVVRHDGDEFHSVATFHVPLTDSSSQPDEQGKETLSPAPIQTDAMPSEIGTQRR